MKNNRWTFILLAGIFAFALLALGFDALNTPIARAESALLENGTQAAVQYAAPAAQGADDCSSWADACTLQSALAAAASGDEIWVQAGVHKPGIIVSDTFTLKSGVAVYGGFAGTETLLEERDWEATPTILSGDIDGDDTTTGGVCLSYTDISGNNSYHVVTGGGGTDSTAVLDGFTITCGQANGPGELHGGGMYSNSSSPTLANLTFQGNWADWGGGGMYNYNSSSPTLINVSFIENTANGTGGGMYTVYSGSPSLVDVYFEGNSAQSGGGMCGYQSSASLTNVTFYSNTASEGGGMFNDDSSPTLTNVSFIENTANGTGGGMYNQYNYHGAPILVDVYFEGNSAQSGGGMSGYQSSASLTNVTFYSNTAASSGGGMYNVGTDAYLVNVTFSGNSAALEGGGMYNMHSWHTLTNVTFTGNWADNGGGICNRYSNHDLVNVIFSNNTAASSGGGVYNYSIGGTGNDPLLTNVNFYGNSAASGGGIFNYDAAIMTVQNAILWGNTGGQIVNLTATVTVTYSDIQGGWAGTGNIDADPLFVDAPNGDLHLSAGSPAIDAGTNTGCPAADLDGTSRPLAGYGHNAPTCDMGAYERPNSPPAAAGDTFSVAKYLPSILDVLANDVDPGDTLTITQVSAPLNGSASTDGESIVYTPTLGYLGADSLTYTISDGILTDTAVVTLTVTATPAAEMLPMVNYALGASSHSATSGDLDGDGDLDLVAANDGSISVLLGNGDGSFAAAVNNVTGIDAWGMATGDLDGDGDLDLAVADGGASVSVLLGNGDGSFAAAVPYGVGSMPSSVAFGDLDRDGDLDLAVANLNSDTVSVLLGNGNGTFASAVNYAAGDGPRFVAAGDLDGDGDLDLAVADIYSASVSILLGDGNGSFTNGSAPVVSPYPRAVDAADLNKDGDLDLVVVNELSNNLSVLLGNGDGTFAAAVNYAVGSDPVAVIASDLNRDGSLDLIAANYYDNDVSLLLGNGDGSFATAITYSVGTGPGSVTAADLDGDGDLDLATANFSSKDASVLLNVTPVQPTGIFEPLVEYTVDLNPQPVVTSDLNRDDKLDLAVANRSGYNVSVLLGDGDGSFAPQTTYAVDGGPESLLAADLDGDGDPDLATANSNPGNVSVLLGNGDGSFAAAMPYTAGDGANFVVAGDLDRDGDLDLVTANLYADTVSVLLGNGDGTFAAASNIAVSHYPLSVAVGDLDRDGILDIFVTYSSVTNVSVLIGNGDGTFAAQADHAMPSGSPHVTGGDVNKDGRLDLVAVGGGNVIVMLGDGLGGFESTTTYPTEAGAYHTTIGDFNRDGDPDLVTANYSSQSLSVLFGNGDGSFAAAVNYLTGANSEATAAGDLDRDGDLDLVVTMPNPSSVGVLLNQEYPPEIELIGYGSGMPIEDGSTMPNFGNGTDFGSVLAASGSLTTTFVISNTGVADLNVSNILITGTTPADFSLAGIALPVAIPPEASALFYLIFDPSTPGLISATVEIANDDGDENPFDFVIQGTGGNSGPIAVADDMVVAENTPAFLHVLSNDSDPDGDPIFIVEISAPLHGSAVIFNGTTIIYTPTLGYLGMDQFIYTISDGYLTDMAPVTVTVSSPCQVTNLNDSGPGSLRQALLEANPGNTICFASDLSGEILFASPIVLSQDVTITSRAGIIFTSGIARSPQQGTTRLLEVSPNVNVTLDGVTITNGYAPGTGGGILNQGALTLLNCSFTNNIAGMGGAIYNLGTLTLSHTTLHGNMASVGGGLYNAGALTINSSVLSQNGGGNCYRGTPIFSGGYNVSSDATCQLGGSNDRNNMGAQTQAVQMDGTAPLLADSIAIFNVTNPALCSGADQAGNPRSAPCDAGALEFLDVPAPRLQASLRADISRPYQGQIFNLTLTVQDVGPAAAANLGINLPLPAGLDYAGAAAWTGGTGCTLGTPPAMLTCASLPADSSLVLSVPVQVTTANVDEQLTAFAAIAADGGVSTSASLTLITTTPPQPPAAGRYVSTTGLDSGPCSTPETACRTIAYTLGQAVDGDTLYLASGTYTEHDIVINKSVTIQGLNGAANTILDAGQAGRVLALPLGVTVTLDGLTIQNGLGALGGFGGGIYNNGTLTVQNCILNGNAGPISGGGIYNDGTLAVINSMLSGNTATMFGGGLYNAGVMTVTNSTLSGNFAGLGGGINNHDGTLTVLNSIISGNTSTRQGGIFSVNEWTVSNSVLQDATPGSNNIVADPRFVRIPFTNGSDDYGDLRLMPGSPGIGRGLGCPEYDLVGTARLNHCTSGAYEFLYGVATPLRQPEAGKGVFTFENQAGTAMLSVPPQAVNQIVYLAFNYSPEDWGQIGTLKSPASGHAPQDWGQIGTLNFANGGFTGYDADYNPLPEGFTFLRPMTLTLEYNPDILNGLELDLTPVRFNPLSDGWEIFTDQVIIDPLSRTVSFPVLQAGEYRLLGMPPGLYANISAATPGSVVNLASGSVITYTLTALNSTPDPLYNLEMGLTLPDGLEFLDWIYANGATYDGGAITWEMDSLASLGLQWASFAVQVSSDALYYGQTITTSVTLNTPGKASVNGATIISINGPNVPVPDRVTTEEDTAFSLRPAANDYNPDLSPLVITEVGSPAHGEVRLLGDTIVYTPTLGYHGSDSFNYTVQDGQFTSTSTVSVRVASLAYLNVAKIMESAGDISSYLTDLPKGHVLTYTISLYNAPDGVIAENVVLTDVLPAGIQFVEWIDQSGATLENGVITWSAAEVPIDTTVTISYRVVITGQFGGVVENTVYATASNANPAQATAVFTVMRPHLVFLPTMQR